MKRIIPSVIGGVALMVSGSQSFAADPYVDPQFNWTGLYLGVESGFRNSKADVSLPRFALTDSQPSLNALVLGSEIGYRHQFNNPLVLGISADVAAFLGDENSAQLTGFPNAFWKVESDWDASIQASLGFAFDRALFYGMGGVAFTNISGCGVSGGACSPATDFSSTRTGWTVGAGLAYAWTDDWISNVEYHYSDFGTKTYSTPGSAGDLTDVDLKSHSLTVGLQYRF